MALNPGNEVNVSQNPYGPKGFTDKVIEYLGSSVKLDYGLYRGVITAEQLIKVVELLSEAQLEEAQNEGPKLRDLVELARKDRRCKFEIYIVPKDRWDERVTVEGVLIPKERKDLIDLIMRRAADRPSEVHEVRDKITYLRLWWD